MTILKDFQKAITRLDEVLGLEKTDIVRDSAIKRFELCFDLAWKSIRIHSLNQGVECNSPRECFKTAFQLALIDYDERWLKMIDDRNLTTHLYKEESAEQVYTRLPEYTEMFKKLLTKLQTED
ncbi:MAG: HI0074 family nucleotidyltransferase substrate-binding subunit [Elusimicrobiota bacterium]